MLKRFIENPILKLTIISKNRLDDERRFILFFPDVSLGEVCSHHVYFDTLAASNEVTTI